MDRQTAVAGSFYPSNPKTLKKTVDTFIKDAPKNTDLKLKGVIVPHAGYIYSGSTAGYAYSLIKNNYFKIRKKITVFILAPAHFAYTTASLGCFDAFLTPLGKIKVNLAVCENLQKEKIFELNLKPHLPEHSIEVQLPFLQETIASFEIVPILLGEIEPKILAEKLKPYFIQNDNLFIISSDLSHYQPYNRAILTDRRTIEIITALNTDKLDLIDACGKTGIATAMYLSKATNAKIKLLDYRNSGDTTDNKQAVVGYGAFSISS
jgi:AmmeMemoRadiSam system protein B